MPMPNVYDDDEETLEFADESEYTDEYCEHDCGESDCFDDGFEFCHHEHCPNCGGCGCPGYCDDYQTYNLRPGETGGAA